MLLIKIVHRKIVDGLIMGVDISKQELDEKIKKISQTSKSELFSNDAIKKEKRDLLSNFSTLNLSLQLLKRF